MVQDGVGQPRTIAPPLLSVKSVRLGPTWSRSLRGLSSSWKSSSHYLVVIPLLRLSPFPHPYYASFVSGFGRCDAPGASPSRSKSESLVHSFWHTRCHHWCWRRSALCSHYAACVHCRSALAAVSRAPPGTVECGLVDDGKGGALRLTCQDNKCCSQYGACQGLAQAVVLPEAALKPRARGPTREGEGECVVEGNVQLEVVPCFPVVQAGAERQRTTAPHRPSVKSVRFPTGNTSLMRSPW